MNVLFRQQPSLQYKQIGGAGRRFFEEANAVPIAGGGVVHSGFMQYVSTACIWSLKLRPRSFRPVELGQPVVQLKDSYSAFIQPGLGHVSSFMPFLAIS